MPATTTPRSLTQALLRFDTINPPGQEEPCARFVGKLLEDGGFAVEMREFAEGRTSLVARIEGSGEAPPICFTGHLDTVPLGAADWRRDPFVGEIDGGKLYGRGATDMKSGIAAMVLAALGIARTSPRERGLMLVLTAGEETGCEGARDLVRHGLLGQAGAIVVGEPTSNHPLLGHKGALWLRACVAGKTAHGSMPEEGDNAIYKAAHAIAKLESFRFEAPPHPLLTAPTLSVNTVSGGRNINSVPDRAEFCLDIRTVPGRTHDETVRQLRTYVGDDVDLSRIVDVEGIATDPDDPWIRQVFDATAAVTGESMKPRAAPYFTDASALTPALGSPPTVILGPGEMAMAHQTDEYCLIERIDEATAIYAEIAKAWCRA